MFTGDQFHNRFVVVSNNADGNCLFESIEYLIKGAYSASEIREMVGEFYRNFDKCIDYPESTIENTIKIGNLFDNFDHEMQHDYNIWNDNVWASMTDVLICSLIFEVNINLYKYHSEIQMYHVEKITSQYNFTNTIDLLYNGINHFEALEPGEITRLKNTLV
jgi:hypothetical protein